MLKAVWHWWSVVYAVFSSGGDLAPVQAQLVEDWTDFQILKHLMPAAKWIRYKHMYSLSFLWIGLDKLLCYLLYR